MTERIFNADNEKDVKELFELIDTIYKRCDRIINLDCAQITERVYDFGYSDDGNLKFQINWNSKTGIERPEDKSKWIGKWCKFWDNECNTFIINILSTIDENSNYQYCVNKTNRRSQNCRPLTKSEWEEIGKTNEF